MKLRQSLPRVEYHLLHIKDKQALFKTQSSRKPRQHPAYSCPHPSPGVPSAGPSSSITQHLVSLELEGVLSCSSHVQLLATPRTAAHQAPLPMGFSRQEHWSGVPSPSLKMDANVLNVHKRLSIVFGTRQQAAISNSRSYTIRVIIVILGYLVTLGNMKPY